ncbi:SACE_7040 family transcriptional regulator [Mycolicibacterium fortuitum]|uniref:SACE_7040 family transcriptional regulator n=1 Tax=Mycolicibacterium fortuitum TaxID=1766 RepID=UPI0007EA012E|nr:TetR/AcrR family transcriptional regulator [Mycolicibacterium fortuitum]MBP3085515.1 TetR/AcrR family transcriptional regulator [Mycolicibacterium fortuitum]OBB00906.1 TetR family transcriptional regulator [Mycolicibacterium fortuitum]OBI71416.1 TetR family transcriptional regulator [Mycolicibacterium fortuitum]
MSDSAVTRRSKAKSDRRSQLIAAAERLIAERGYLAVRLEDICSAVGISGPAIYRHFPNKEALLVELLVGISTRLLAGAQRVTSATEDPAESLNGLVDFHLDFVFGEPDLIRIQDRDLAHLPDAARRQVRRSQRQYVEIWVAVLTQLTPDLAEEDARVMAHAVFGLLNSTPYSARPAVPKAHSRALLRRMTLAALTAS